MKHRIGLSFKVFATGIMVCIAGFIFFIVGSLFSISPNLLLKIISIFFLHHSNGLLVLFIHINFSASFIFAEEIHMKMSDDRGKKPEKSTIYKFFENIFQ